MKQKIYQSITLIVLVNFLLFSMGFTVSSHYCSYCGKTQYFIFHHQACCNADEASHHQDDENVIHHHKHQLDEETHICHDIAHCATCAQKEVRPCQTHHHIFKITAPYSIHKHIVLPQISMFSSSLDDFKVNFIIEKESLTDESERVAFIPPLQDAFYIYVHQLVYYA